MNDTDKTTAVEVTYFIFMAMLLWLTLMMEIAKRVNWDMLNQAIMGNIPL